MTVFEEKMKTKFTYMSGALNDYLTTFLRTNKRVDRDSVIRTKAKLEAYAEIFALMTDNSMKDGN